MEWPNIAAVCLTVSSRSDLRSGFVSRERVEARIASTRTNFQHPKKLGQFPDSSGFSGRLPNQLDGLTGFLVHGERVK